MNNTPETNTVEVTENKWFGNDASLSESFFEYGLIAKATGNPGEYTVIFRTTGNNYGVVTMTEMEINNLLSGDDWMSWRDIQDFMGFVGNKIHKFIELPFIHKLQSLLLYYGYQNIIQSNPCSYLTQEVIEKFNLPLPFGD